MKYVVGSNSPGYLPETSPVPYDTFEEAVAGMKFEMEQARSVLYPADSDEGDHKLKEANESVDIIVSTTNSETSKVDISVQLFDISFWLRTEEEEVADPEED